MADPSIICNNHSYPGAKLSPGDSLVWENDIRSEIKNFGRDLPTAEYWMYGRVSIFGQQLFTQPRTLVTMIGTYQAAPPRPPKTPVYRGADSPACAQYLSRMPPRESSPQRTVLAAIQAGTFAPVYYLYGDDDYLKDVAINDLLGAALDPSSRDFNCDVRRASELDAEGVNDILGTPPMLAERRAVVIRDVGALKKAARAQLDKYLVRPASDTLLLLTSPNGAKTDAPIEKQTVALNFEPLSPERVRKWIAHHAATALKMAIADDAAQLMQQAVGNDLQMLAGELDKCASYMLGLDDNATSIDADAVSAVVGVRRGETVADLLDAVARHDAAAAVHLLPHVLNQPKMSGVVLVMMLSTQTFALAHGRARREAGVSTSRLPQEFFAFLKEAGGYPGRPWGEAASAWTKAVDGWSTRSCERALELLLNADMALKDTTISDAEQTMTSLVLALCALKPRGRKAA